MKVLGVKPARVTIVGIRIGKAYIDRLLPSLDPTVL